MGAKQSRAIRNSGNKGKTTHNVDLFTQYCIDDVELRNKVMGYIQETNNKGGKILSLQDLVKSKDAMKDIIALISSHDATLVDENNIDIDDQESWGTGFTEAETTRRSSIFDEDNSSFLLALDDEEELDGQSGFMSVMSADTR